MKTCSCVNTASGPLDPAWLISWVALALVLVLLGVLLIVPGEQWPAFGIGLGAILLGANLLRHRIGLGSRRLGIAAGTGALSAGLAGLYWPESSATGVFLLAAGIVALLSAARGLVVHR